MATEIEIPDDARTFANAVRAVIAWHVAHGFAAGAEGPGQLPYVQVTRIGGPSDEMTDHAQIDVDYFHSSRAEALAFARKGHYWMTDIRNGLRGQQVGIDAVDDVRTRQGPSWQDYDDPKIERFVATYDIDSRICSTPLT
ncbi:hypothetical protein [Gordonia soli]|uniref:Uncharacterized protein n=1 Tax=Gordonia soli NBRC 108243 TaxID=1223545 RepID=M0QQ70_9ACTN|nr:hypothetical protein [Gordonia soli]GAC70728.1 hypothetical protein GS4_39_00590 [Gordonia soli NBRC 108243]